MACKEKKIGLGMDFSKGSKAALKWSIDSLVKTGDVIYIIHVNHKQALESRNLLWVDSGSPLIPFDEFCNPEVMHGYGVEVDPEVLEMLTIAHSQQVTVFAKIYWGDAREKVCEAVGSLRLDSLVMGSRGLGTIQRVLLGSVTNYVLEHAGCPVTVVKGRTN